MLAIVQLPVCALNLTGSSCNASLLGLVTNLLHDCVLVDRQVALCDVVQTYT